MAKHSGYESTHGSGRLPKANFALDVPAIDRTLLRMALEANMAAAELDCSVRDVLCKIRASGLADYDDETLERIARLAETR